MTEGSLPPINIRVGGVNSHPFKSISELRWENIPAFAILTGLNGSGKTQFLELLAHHISGTSHLPNMGHLQTEVEISGDKFGPGDLAYIPAAGVLSHVQDVALGGMEQAKQQTLNHLSHGRNRDWRSIILHARLSRQLGRPIRPNDQTELLGLVPSDYSFMLEPTDVMAGLSHVFVAHLHRIFERSVETLYGSGSSENRVGGNNESDAVEIIRRTIRDQVGPAPWDVLNEVLRSARFPYRVVPPKMKLLEPYRLSLEDTETGTSRSPGDLSSGEKVLFQLVLWLYQSKHHDIFPRILLLDEPDAHLHPSMTRQLIDVIKGVFVDRYRVRVILTTHSPSTVALAPEGSVFEMSRSQSRVRPSATKEDTIGLLTAGLVIVSPNTRYVLVEDDEDVKFYGVIRDMLSDFGTGNNPNALKPSPSLVFLPASLGKGSCKVGGGKTVVQKWVDKFDSPPLSQMFRGLIDLDDANTPTSRVLVLGRYSIENYLVDPLVVFGVLLEGELTGDLSELRIPVGDEYRLRGMLAPELQKIVDRICIRVEPRLSGLDAVQKRLQPVTFSSGQIVNYPSWALRRRGRDLLQAHRTVFGDNLIVLPRLYNSLQRVRLIPVELFEIMSKLQQA